MLHPDQILGIQARIPHFDPDRCAPLFHDDQEAQGFPVGDQGRFPGVLMRDGTVWFYDKERRPRRPGKDGQLLNEPMKCKAPAGGRGPVAMPQCRDSSHVLVVEGEGDLVALVSAGYEAAMSAGGVNVLLATGGDAGVRGRAARRAAFAGKHVYVFDFDEPGVKGARSLARLLLGGEGETRLVDEVGVIAMPEDWRGEAFDLLDWLATFESTEQALGSVEQVLGRVHWAGRPEDVGASRGPWRGYDAAGQQGGEAAEAGRQGRPTQADDLFRITEELKIWKTPAEEPFVTISFADGHREHWPLPEKGGRIGPWLVHEFAKRHGRAPSQEAVRQVRSRLRGQSFFDSPIYEVHVRIAQDGEAIYVDLADEKWRVVRIDSRGWKVIPASEAPVRFRRTSGMLPIPEPQKGGSIDDLKKLVPVSDDDFVILVAWVLSAFRARGPHWILSIGGEHGTGKTWTAKTIRALIDPNKAAVRGEPKDHETVHLQANNSWVVALDNLSRVQPWLSDLLCGVATGAGMGKRKHYEDTDEVILSYCRPVILGSIGDIATRSDLRSRVLSIKQQPIKEYRSEEELLALRARLLPGMLGAVYDGLAAAIQNLPKTKPSGRYRNGGAEQWALAAEPAMPWPAGTLDRLLAEEDAAGHQSMVESSPFGMALIQLLADSDGSWEGTTGELLEQARAKARVESGARGWPASARGTTNMLRNLAPSLRALGVTVEETKKQGGKGDRRRQITMAEDAEARELVAAKQPAAL